MRPTNTVGVAHPAKMVTYPLLIFFQADGTTVDLPYFTIKYAAITPQKP